MAGLLMAKNIDKLNIINDLDGYFNRWSVSIIKKIY